MKAFSEKCDTALRYLKDHDKICWCNFTQETAITKDDAILIFLKDRKDFITYTDTWVRITAKGKQFISSSSFAGERKIVY
jgi:hypothetical protein